MGQVRLASSPVDIGGRLDLLIEVEEPRLDRVERVGRATRRLLRAALVGYRLDLRQWVEWITNLHIDVLTDAAIRPAARYRHGATTSDRALSGTEADIRRHHRGVQPEHLLAMGELNTC